MSKEETVWYLEMLDRSDLRPASSNGPELDVRQAKAPCVRINWFFYCAVGGPWSWTDRYRWSPDEWRRYVHDPSLETWIGSVDGAPVGYAEILREADGETSIESFGLLPQRLGMGLGGRFLTHVVEAAWAPPTRRVRLHTCSFDHPHALGNYKARGFRVYRTARQPKAFFGRPPLPPYGRGPIDCGRGDALDRTAKFDRGCTRRPPSLNDVAAARCKGG